MTPKRDRNKECAAWRIEKSRLTVDEQLARRMLARAVELKTDLQAVAPTSSKPGWATGAQLAVHVVARGETLVKLSRRYYGDDNKALVIAAYNEITDPNALRVGQVLRMPNAKSTPVTPLRKGESPYLFGIHDRGGEHLMGWSGRKGWVLVTEALGADPNDWSGRNYADLSDQGYGVMARLNHGYNPQGTLPASRNYGNFARRVGNMVERSSGCHIWMIGNEPNLAVERPGGPDHGEVITAEMYARCYRLCREEIRSRPGHADDQVVTAAIGPWNIQTKYAGKPHRRLDRLLPADAGPVGQRGGWHRDSHLWARWQPGQHHQRSAHGWGFEHRRSMFRTYIDYMQAIPPLLRICPSISPRPTRMSPGSTSPMAGCKKRMLRSAVGTRTPPIRRSAP